MNAPKVSPALAKRLANQIGISYSINNDYHGGLYPTVAQLQAFGNACVKEAIERLERQPEGKEGK